MKKQWYCIQCKHFFTNYREFIVHYDEHPNSLKKYHIKNARLKAQALIYSPNLPLALEFLGWNEWDCKYKEIN